MREMNFIHEDLPETDRDLFFGPLEPHDEFLTFSTGDTLAHLAVKWKVFPSVTQARKNGWDGEIPPGFSEHQRGKRKF